MDALKDYWGKNKFKVGYTLLALSVAIFILKFAQPFVEDPSATKGQRQFAGMFVVFSMVLIFGLVKNFVWDDSWKSQAPTAGASASAIKEQEPTKLQTSGKVQKRTPKM